MCILNTNVCMIRMSVIFFSRHAFCNTFSTHDLSWRSTDTIATMIAAITFQLTTSRGGRLTSITITSYCPVFQLTTSRGGRQAPANMSTTLFYFQLTTSRGGRRIRSLLSICDIIFNSRPLVEVDNILFCM